MLVIKDNVDIYVFLNNDNVIISVPAYDIYEKTPVLSVVKNNKIEFKFYGYKYVYNSKNVFKYDLKEKQNYEILNFTLINENTRTVIKKSRRELLKEPFLRADKKNKWNIKFDFSNENYKVLSQMINYSSWIDNRDEMSKIKSILNWINNNLKHKGDLDLPFLNSIELLKIAKKNGGYLNCRSIAVITNDLLLMSNIKSQFVICMQKEKNTDNYHVLNNVYLENISKWILVDPSYNLLLFDKKNEILSIKEVREKLANDEKIYKNREANYYNKPLSMTLYLKSLTKNFYRFIIPIISSFDSDNNSNLLMLTPYKNYSFKNMTDNPDLFWNH